MWKYSDIERMIYKLRPWKKAASKIYVAGKPVVYDEIATVEPQVAEQPFEVAPIYEEKIPIARMDDVPGYELPQYEFDFPGTPSSIALEPPHFDEINAAIEQARGLEDILRPMQPDLQPELEEPFKTLDDIFQPPI